MEFELNELVEELSITYLQTLPIYVVDYQFFSSLLMYDIGLNANATMKSIHKKSNPLIIFEITICINVFEFISKCNQDKRIG